MPAVGTGKWQLAFPELSEDVRNSLLHKTYDAIRRCTDEDHAQYYDWGGRGIHVYPDWLKDRTAFIAYLITLSGYDDLRLWLDRIDSNGHYEPGNLRFVVPAVSQCNRRRQTGGTDSLLSKLRLRLNLSLHDVVFLTGCSWSTLRHAENGTLTGRKARKMAANAYWLLRKGGGT